VKRALIFRSSAALLLPANAFARGEFDPTKEFEQHEWVPIHLGPINLSITKAVVYLMLGSALTIVFGIVFMRARIGQKAPDILEFLATDERPFVRGAVRAAQRRIRTLVA